MNRNPNDSTYTPERRIPFNYNDNPCKRDCLKRKAECAKTCPDWAVYEDVRTKRYRHNEMVYGLEAQLKTPANRDKRGQL